MLLLSDTHEERWDVHELSADGDVLLSDENASVMDGSSELSLLNLSLEAALEELGGGKSEHIIELALRVLQETKAHHTSDKGLTYCSNIKLDSQLL